MLKGRNPCFSGICFSTNDKEETISFKLTVVILVLVEFVFQHTNYECNNQSTNGRNPCFSGICFSTLFKPVIKNRYTKLS